MNVLISLFLIPVNVTPTHVDIALMAQGENGSQRIIASDVVFSWDTSKLRFVGIDNTGGLPAILSTIPSGPEGDYTGINETVPPADGTGMYWWLGQLGAQIYVSDPVRLTTFKFEVVSPFATTTVDLVPELVVDYVGRTIVYGSNVGGTPVTGVISGCTITNCPCDLSDDGYVDSQDLGMALADWNEGTNTLLAEILGSWGPCN